MDVGVGLREIVALGPLLGHFHAVADDVVAARIQAGEQAVPFALHIFGLQAQMFGNGAGDFHVIAHQGVGVVVVAPGGPRAFQRHDQGAALAGGFQTVGRFARSGGAGSAGRAGSGRGRPAGAEGAGGGQNGHQGNKVPSFHCDYTSLCFFVTGWRCG